ncbi:MAG: hypothetical protein AAFS10_03795 [Myxococcota bacterium]
MTEAGQEQPQQRLGVYLDGEPSTNPKVIATARSVRRIGYPILVTLTLLVSVPVIVGVVRGVATNQIWDPHTKIPVDRSIPNHYNQVSCRGQGLRLLANMRQPEQRPDDATLARWSEQCARFEADIHRTLQELK